MGPGHRPDLQYFLHVILCHLETLTAKLLLMLILVLSMPTTMLVAAGSTAATTTRRGLLRSTPAVVLARAQASRVLSVSVTAQPNTHLRTCGPDAVLAPQLRLQLQARSYVTLKPPHSAFPSSRAWRCFSSNSWNWSSGGDKASPSSSSASSSGAQTAGQSTADATATDGPADVDAKVQREVLDRCEALHASLMPLNEKVSSFVVLRCSRLVGRRYHITMLTRFHLSKITNWYLIAPRTAVQTLGSWHLTPLRLFGGQSLVGQVILYQLRHGPQGADGRCCTN